MNICGLPHLNWWESDIPANALSVTIARLDGSSVPWIAAPNGGAWVFFHAGVNTIQAPSTRGYSPGPHAQTRATELIATPGRRISGTLATLLGTTPT